MTAAYELFRTMYGLLLVGLLALEVPNRKRFFLSARWGGYGDPSFAVDAIQNPAVMPGLLTLWLASAVALAAGFIPLVSAAICFVINYYFFIWARWRGVARGMGAPGYISWWLSAVVLLLEGTRVFAPSELALAMTVARVDFGLILFTAGVSKLFSGYFQGEGMEYGLVNPAWSYFWRLFMKVPSDFPVYKIMDHLAWSMQILIGILCAVPAFQPAGGLLIFLMFAFISLQIRLGTLGPMLCVAALLYVPDPWLGLPLQSSGGHPWVHALLMTYLILRPTVVLGMWWNYFAKKRLPFPFQLLLDRYTNVMGIILWRVFTVDVLNFFVEIDALSAQGARRLSRYGRVTDFRFNDVSESIAITSIFTTLRYFTSNRELFERRLLSYARGFELAPGEVLRFRYVAIIKKDGRFTHQPAMEWTVDPPSGRIDEKTIDPALASGVVYKSTGGLKSVAQGSYAPARPS